MLIFIETKVSKNEVMIWRAEMELARIQYNNQEFREGSVKFFKGSGSTHIRISIPPKYSVSHIVGFIKGKSAIAIARIRRQLGREGNFTGESFQARGYFVSTVGLDEERVRAYIRDQEREDARYDQLKLAM